MVYQQILSDGSKIGQYNIKSSPAKVAEKIAKQTYIANGWRGEKTFEIKFCKNLPFKEYNYKVNVLPVNEKIFVGNGYIDKKYDIQVRKW